MSDTQPVATPDSPAAPSHPSVLAGTRALSFAGLIFIYMALAAFVALGYRSITAGGRPPEVWSYMPEIFLFVSGVFSALLGVGLIRSAGLAAVNPSLVINQNEWETVKEAVKEGNEDAISQYVRLTSLTGFTGFFTKLGLQGLPLATIALTIFFALLFLKDPQYLELAKLTLGAFIGSFVQKQVGAGQSAGKVQLASGETIKVTPSAPPVA